MQHVSVQQLAELCEQNLSVPAAITLVDDLISLPAGLSFSLTQHAEMRDIYMANIQKNYFKSNDSSRTQCSLVQTTNVKQFYEIFHVVRGVYWIPQAWDAITQRQQRSEMKGVAYSQCDRYLILTTYSNFIFQGFTLETLNKSNNKLETVSNLLDRHSLQINHHFWGWN